MANLVDISNIPSNGKSYDGKTRKYGITINGIDYIVKFPKDRDMSVWCEYIASNLISRLGISCHEVSLGVVNGTMVNVIKDFTSGGGISLHSFKDTQQSSEDTDIGNKEYTYKDVVRMMDAHLKMSDAAKEKAKRQFWNMFICDAIIGNRDRHAGNWGYIKTKRGYKFAPLYDNGAGLYPGVNNVISNYANPSTRAQFIYDRVYTVPASIFRITGPGRTYKSNYAKMFSDLRVNRTFAQQVSAFTARVKYTDIMRIMHSICWELPLDMWYKRFYIEITTMRYMCIVLRMNFNKAYNIVEGYLNGQN